jgi:hypothetical protein
MTTTPSLTKLSNTLYSFGNGDGKGVMISAEYNKLERRHTYTLRRDGYRDLVAPHKTILTLRMALPKLIGGMIPTPINDSPIPVGVIVCQNTFAGLADLADAKPVEAVKAPHNPSPLSSALSECLEASNLDPRSEDAQDKYWAFYELLKENIAGSTMEPYEV